MDREFVNRLARLLASLGFEVWYDQWKLDVGDSLIEKIQAGIKWTDWLIVVLSPVSVTSKWVKEELNAALSGQLRGRAIGILPVLLGIN